MIVLAGGGLVVRRSVTSALELLLVHRPRYDDWTFPKGKAREDEPLDACALREVEEETGLRCALGLPLGALDYTDALGRPKVVRYWTMRPLDGRFSPSAEVDRVLWASAPEAARLLTYERERPLLDALVAGPLYVLRHASAGDRDAWTGDDRVRPLDARGRRQAAAIASALARAGVERVLSSPHRRCVETVEPLAAATGLPLEERDELAEGARIDDALSVACRGAVLCTHGDVCAGLLGGRHLAKGALWRLELGPAAPLPVEPLATAAA